MRGVVTRGDELVVRTISKKLSEIPTSTMLSTLLSTENCPTSAPFFGFMGVTSALVFANIGAGT